MSSNIMLFFSEVANCIVSILHEHGMSIEGKTHICIGYTSIEPKHHIHLPVKMVKV